MPEQERMAAAEMTETPAVTEPSTAVGKPPPVLPELPPLERLLSHEHRAFMEQAKLPADKVDKYTNWEAHFHTETSVHVPRVRGWHVIDILSRAELVKQIPVKGILNRLSNVSRALVTYLRHRPNIDIRE